MNSYGVLCLEELESGSSLYVVLIANLVVSAVMPPISSVCLLEFHYQETNHGLFSGMVA